MLSTLRRIRYEEKVAGAPSNRFPLKTVIARLTELLSRAG
jgi:hypothetical protein